VNTNSVPWIRFSARGRPDPRRKQLQADSRTVIRRNALKTVHYAGKLRHTETCLQKLE
jgi:hypothetical protein